MTERKWTPGPWTVEYKHGTTRLVADGEVTMCDETYYPWTPVNDADWHLIAAAPDLYEALEAGVELIKGDSVGKEWKQCCAAFIKDARDALAKARGHE